MAYKEIYQRYFSKLIKCLPMDDGLFLAMLSEHELLPGDTEGKVKSLATQTEKATYFISHVIKPSLDVDSRVYLNKLLLVMSESGYKHVEEISSKIKSEIANTENSKTRKVVIEKSSNNKVNDDYTERFTHDSDAIGAFVYLFNKLAAFFDEVEFKKFKRICTLRGADCPQDFRKQMQAAETLDDILDTLEKPNYCNWLNIRLLKRIVNLTEIPEAKSLLDAYEKCLYSKKVSEVRPYFKSIYFDPKHFTVVKAKVNKHADKLFVSDVIQFCETLESDFSFPEVIATDCDSGCFKITCVIPVQCTSHAYKMARENLYKFRKFHIHYIEVESYQKLFAMSYCISKVPSDLPLSSSKGFKHIISDHYTYLEAHMDADSVSHMMHCEHLITDDDYDAITAAPNDTKMNCLLLHYVKSMDTRELFKFCDILKSIERMQGIGESLEVLLKSSELKYYSASGLHKEQKSLKMNKWTSNVEPSQIDLKFFELIDEIILLLSAADKISYNFSNKCRSLMASNTHNIPLFTESFVNKLINCKSVFQLKVLLLPFLSWFDHSILKVLTSESDCVTDLLTQFDSLIDHNEPITAYPIPTLSQMMIPLDNRFTIVATKSFSDLERTSLEDIMNIKVTLTEHWNVTDHAVQLIAICTKLNYLYWIVPKCVVSVITHSSHNYEIQYKLWQKGITMTTILYDLYTDDLNIDTGGPFSVLSYQHEMESSQYIKLVSLEATEVVKQNTLIHEKFFIQYQRLKSEHQRAMAKLDSAEATLKLKVPILENENETLMKKYQEIKQKNSELENSNVLLQKENELLNQINPQSQKVYKGGTVDTVSHKIKDEAYSRQVPVEISMHKQKSDQAADTALKRISVDLIHQLDLFNTTLHLYGMGGFTPLEMEKLGNVYKTELERKQYLVTTVIPSKGHYRGMKLLMRALRQTEQYEILSLLEETYVEEVNAILKHKTGEQQQAEATNIKVLQKAQDNTVIQWVGPLKEKDPIMKFVFVGDTCTGKTSLVERYVNNKFFISQFQPTTGADRKCLKVTCYNTNYELHLWDTAGQERYMALSRTYYRGAVGGFVVYDVNEKETLDRCLLWKKEIEDVQSSNGDPIPIILIANKIDCGRLDGEQFSKENGFAGYFETSALTGAGVKEAIHFMVKKAHEQRADQPIFSRADQQTFSHADQLPVPQIKLQNEDNYKVHRRQRCRQS